MLVLGLIPSLEAQVVSTSTEAWILYEQARAKQEDREAPEPGEALYLYRQAIERAEIFPEAEVAIGEIYLREGAFKLAEEQFKKALSYSAAFLISERKYLVRYRLAELYELQERYADMEKELAAIVDDQAQYSGSSPLDLTDAILDTYFRRGLDQVFTLYRMNESTFAMTAHAKLGWFKYRTGQFNPGSITHSLFALNIVVTEAMTELRRTVPGFEYTTLNEFADAGMARPAVRSYLIESGFAEMLYYLATATFAAAKPLRAREVWTDIAGFDPQLAGRYGDLARRQLREPWVDAYLNPSPRIIEYPSVR
jgi:tetratricopeptide (TPR) repeat protein